MRPWLHPGMAMVLRWMFRGGLVAGALLALAGLVGVTTVDRAPFEGQPYAESTRQRLAEATAGGALPTLVGKVRAGFGRAKLTPVLGAATDDPERGEFRWVPLAGYGSRQGKPATGVKDDVWVKAVAFAVGGQTGVVVTADALIISGVAEGAVERLRGRLGLERRNVYFGATHTHCGLGGWGQGWVGGGVCGRISAGGSGLDGPSIGRGRGVGRVGSPACGWGVRPSGAALHPEPVGGRARFHRFPVQSSGDPQASKGWACGHWRFRGPDATGGFPGSCSAARLSRAGSGPWRARG